MLSQRNLECQDPHFVCSIMIYKVIVWCYLGFLQVMIEEVLYVVTTLRGEYI